MVEFGVWSIGVGGYPALFIFLGVIKRGDRIEYRSI
jgi:hypothetical protein